MTCCVLYCLPPLRSAVGSKPRPGPRSPPPASTASPLPRCLREIFRRTIKVGSSSALANEHFEDCLKEQTNCDALLSRKITNQNHGARPEAGSVIVRRKVSSASAAGTLAPAERLLHVLHRGFVRHCDRLTKAGVEMQHGLEDELLRRLLRLKSNAQRL